MRASPTSLFLAAPLLLMASSLSAVEFRAVQLTSDALESLQAAPENAARRSPAFGRRLAFLLELDDRTSLVLRTEQELLLNEGRILRFSQTYDGIPIWTSEVILEEAADGRFRAVQGEALYNISARETPSSALEVSAADALRLAQQDFERAIESRSLRLPDTTP